MPKDENARGNHARANGYNAGMLAVIMARLTSIELVV